jgi:hypothetical protein
MLISVALILNHMYVNNLWFHCLTSYIVSVKSIRSLLEMTCFVSKISCKVRNVMNIFPHTYIVVTFCRVNSVNMQYVFVERHEYNLCAIKLSMEKTFVQIMYTPSKK